MTVKKKFPHRSAIVACNGSGDSRRTCPHGCLGCGACVSVCPCHAISLNPNGVAAVDEDVCTGCGKCVEVCVQNIIRLHDSGNRIVVRCSNTEKGADARKTCNNSCIGCGRCEKICTASAVEVQNNCAVIHEAYCLSCGMCVGACPRGAICDTKGIY